MVIIAADLPKARRQHLHLFYGNEGEKLTKDATIRQQIRQFSSRNDYFPIPAENVLFAFAFNV